ncbi:hypothetical protein AMELA_G00032070 [Ameiurus melas]|uniref:Uncharacterized protein n=1 Tax=Ameiurus melas TaxID=219545 RepID=A0A7J6B7C2_AMEME|nr:hypothetical protein AMELA_G00032070 [Ameiurus melas]
MTAQESPPSEVESVKKTSRLLIGRSDPVSYFLAVFPSVFRFCTTLHLSETCCWFLTRIPPCVDVSRFEKPPYKPGRLEGGHAHSSIHPDGVAEKPEARGTGDEGSHTRSLVNGAG